MAYPAARRQRVLYSTAKRVRDELGKGQEALRTFGPVKITQAGASTIRAIVGIPTVPVRIVDVKVMGESVANLTSINVLAPALYDSAAGAGNRLITELAAAADDTLVYGAVLPLANRVAAEQPINLVVITAGAATGSVEVQVDYILCDEERTY
jgi:hypothetical protein